MATAPPPFPPTSAPPPVPEGWRADWSAEYNTWFYINLSTQQSQWVNPLNQIQQPLSPPEYNTGVQPGAPQYFPPISQPISQSDPNSNPPNPLDPNPLNTPPPDGPDGDRGLGKIGGGILGVAGGLLAGAFINHEIDEHKSKIHKPGFKLWNNNNSSGGGLLSGLGRGGGAAGMFSSFVPGAGGVAAGAGPPAPSGGGGFFSSVSNNMPFSGASSGPPLHIHCAVYADRDVTEACRRMVTGGTTLTVPNGENMVQSFGDPWPGTKKTIAILYSYGQRPWEMITSADREGDVCLIPHQPLDNDRMGYMKGERRVLAVTWGQGNGLESGKGTLEKLTQIETTGEFPATNDWFGFDGLWGHSKTAVVFYRTGHGGVAIATARDNGTVRMPWNPLAKWT